MANTNEHSGISGGSFPHNDLPGHSFSFFFLPYRSFAYIIVFSVAFIWNFSLCVNTCVSASISAACALSSGRLCASASSGLFLF